MPGTRQRIEAVLKERIAVLDGSWGVLIQGQVRGEQAYRGDRFAPRGGQPSPVWWKQSS